MTDQKNDPTDDLTGAVPLDEATPGAEAEAPPEAEAAAPAPEERIAALEAENAQLKSEYLRALAEAQNAKRLADKRIEDNSRYAVSNFAKELLAVADNLGRALLAAPVDQREGNETLKNVATGVEMTEKELISALGKYGVQRIESLNQPFNPHQHQAMQEVERLDVPQGTVIQVYQEGYVIHDRLLRPAMVVVSRGGPKRDTPEAPAGDTEPGVDRSV